MSTEAILGLLCSALGLIASLLAVAFKVGGLAGLVKTHGETLTAHRAESAAATAALRTEVGEVRDDVRGIGERVAKIEGAMPHLRVVGGKQS